jgi:hypothetical protein
MAFAGRAGREKKNEESKPGSADGGRTGGGDGDALGCGRKGKEKARVARVARVKVKQSVPDLDTAERCMEGMMRDPKEAFPLYMMRKDDTAPPFTSEAGVHAGDGGGNDELDRESADQTGQECTWRPDCLGPGNQHAVGPVSTVNRDLRLAQPTAVAAGADPVNGYETVKYDFDTARLPEADKARIAVTLLAKDFNVTGQRVDHQG